MSRAVQNLPEYFNQRARSNCGSSSVRRLSGAGGGVTHSHYQFLARHRPRLRLLRAKTDSSIRKHMRFLLSLSLSVSHPFIPWRPVPSPAKQHSVSFSLCVISSPCLPFFALSHPATLRSAFSSCQAHLTYPVAVSLPSYTFCLLYRPCHAFLPSPCPCQPVPCTSACQALLSLSPPCMTSASQRPRLACLTPRRPSC